MMTKKNFEAAANLCQTYWKYAEACAKCVTEDKDKSSQRSNPQEVISSRFMAQEVENTFSMFFRADNPRFNDDKFRAACRKHTSFA